MPYRRHLRCPLLTTHGHILMLLDAQGTLTRAEIAERLGIVDTHAARLLRELSGDGLVTHERLSSGTWWSIRGGLDVMTRFASDRQ